MLCAHKRVICYDWYFETITIIFRNFKVIAVNLKFEKKFNVELQQNS